MNSSISSSESRGWSGFLVSFFACWLLVLGALTAALVALDPYDTGRFALWSPVGVPKTGQRTADASRGRDPRFDWAIIGNSRIQLIDPARLGKLIGASPVSLAIPGTGPLEQLTVARWFVDHHGDAPRGLVFGLDDAWCQPQRPDKPKNPFPFWLYAPDSETYLLHLVRWQSLEMAVGKIALLSGHAQPARADGYDNYEIGRTWRLEDVQRRLSFAGSEDEGPTTDVTQPADGRFPAADDLADSLRAVASSTAVILVLTPVQASFLPQPDQKAAIDALRSCKAAYAELARMRPNTAVVDFLVDDDLTRPVENFWDPIHYRSTVARAMEERIGAAVQSIAAHR
jgi:hypothetical protein